MALSRFVAFFVVLIMPFLVLAQESGEDTLRSTIRADILSDPRSSEMSSAEIDALVNALATQAESQGVAEEYLEAQNSFDYAIEPPVYEGNTSTPMAIAILSLVLVFALVAALLMWQRSVRRSTTPSSGMVA